MKLILPVAGILGELWLGHEAFRWVLAGLGRGRTACVLGRLRCCLVLTAAGRQSGWPRGPQPQQPLGFAPLPAGACTTARATLPRTSTIGGCGWVGWGKLLPAGSGCESGQKRRSASCRRQPRVHARSHASLRLIRLAPPQAAQHHVLSLHDFGPGGPALPLPGGAAGHRAGAVETRGVREQGAREPGLQFTLQGPRLCSPLSLGAPEGWWGCARCACRAPPACRLAAP